MKKRFESEEAKKAFDAAVKKGSVRIQSYRMGGCSAREGFYSYGFGSPFEVPQDDILYVDRGSVVLWTLCLRDRVGAFMFAD